MNKKNLLLICLIAMMLCVECAVVGSVAPDFTLVDIDGVEFSLSDYREKVVLLSFFRTYCSLCDAEISELKSLHAEFGEDLIIISICVSSSATVEMLQRYRQTHEIDWIVCKDTIGVRDVYGVAIVPTLVLIDQEGYIQFQHVGFVDASVIRQEIYFALTIPGDVDRDYDVDLYDAVRLLVRYGLEEGHPNFDPNCDIDGDGQIFLYDAVILLSHYGEEYP